MGNLNGMIQWMEERKGKVTYSMVDRLGPTSYDCSSAGYYSLITGGYVPETIHIGNTDSLFGDLEKYRWKKLTSNASGNYDAKRGDIFIWGVRGDSSGVSGHTGIFIDDQDQMIHCNSGYNGIAVSNHDQIWALNGRPAVTIYRANNSAPDFKPTRRFGYRVDDLKVFNGVWQIWNNYLCPVDFEWKDNGILPEDIDRIFPDNGTITPDQTLHVGDYFSFKPECVLSADTLTMIQGHQFMRVNLKNSGVVWLSTYGVKNLIYG